MRREAKYKKEKSEEVVEEKGGDGCKAETDGDKAKTDQC